MDTLEPQQATVAITTERVLLKLGSTLKKQENILKEVAKTIDCVRLRINALGEIVSLLNHGEILSKWRRVKTELENEHRGKAMANYINGVEKKLEDRPALLRDFRQYRLFGGMFNKFYFEHSSILSKYNQWDRAVENCIFDKTLHFKETLLLEKIGEHDITLKIKGDFDNEKNRFKAIESEFKARGFEAPRGLKLKTYSGLYAMDKNSGLVKNMELNIETAYGAGYQKKIGYCLAQLIN
ncbi:MAG: hypothetical protein ACPGQR_04455 [Marinirhabdus sp.]